MSHGFNLERIGMAALKRPWAALFLLAILLAAAAASLPRLSFDNDIHRAFLSGSELSQQQQAFENGPGIRTKDYLLLITAERPFTIDDYAAARDLALDVELTEGVVSVVSPFALRFSPAHPDYPEAAVFGVDLDRVTLRQRLSEFRKTNPRIPTLLSPDEMSMIVVASVDTSMRGPAAVTSELRNLVSGRLAQDLSVAITGEDVISVDIVEGLKADLVRLNALGAVLIFILALVVMRSLRITILAVVPALLGALAASSLFVLFGFPVTVINNVIPILVLILGVADNIYLALHLENDHTPGSRDDRIERTIVRIGPACALTAITTAIAFASVLIADNAQLTEFAILGASSIMVSFAVVLVAFALLAKILARREAKPAPGETSGPSHTAFAVWVFNQDRRIIAVSCIAVVLAAWGFSRTEAWFPLYQNLPSGSATQVANERVARDFGGVFRLWIEVDTTGPDAVETRAGWQRLSKIVSDIESAAPELPMASLVGFARWLGTPDAAPVPAQMARIPAGLGAQVLAADGKLARIVVWMPEPMRDRDSLATFDRIERIALADGAVRVVGLPAIMRHESVALISQLAMSLLLACLGATFVIALAFRSPVLVPILLLPNVLPILLTASALHVLTDGQMNPTSVLALTIAFGIAVDDSIHFINRFDEASGPGLAIDDALDHALSSAGRIMAMTTLLISTGLLVTFTSAFFPVRLFGSLIILTLLTALVADLTLLPALLRFTRARFKRAEP